MARGGGAWLDKEQRAVLVLWRSLPEWAALIAEWARGAGYDGGVITLHELSEGEEVQGTELAGAHRELLLRALRVLEGQGKARLFKGTSADDEGVKFSALG